MDDSRSKLMILLLAAVLIMSLLVWSHTRHLQQQLSQLQGELHNLRTYMSHEITGIRGTVQDIRDDARWWNPGDVEFLDTDEDKALVKISWYLQEYQEDSMIFLNYQLPGEEGFKEISGEEESSGYYTALLSVPAPREPLWNIYLEEAREDGYQHSTTVVSEKQIRSGQDFQLRYYITLQEGKAKRTGEVRTLDLSKLSINLFKPLDVRVNMDSEGNINATLQKLNTGRDACYDLQEAHLESRKSDRVLQRWLLAPAPEELNLYSTRAEPGQPYDSLYMVVEYAEGQVFEKKIF